MIDIETLGTKTGSIIYQIAAVEFCPDTFNTGQSLELHICPFVSEKYGLTKDAETITWHKSKGHAKPLTGNIGGALPLGDAIHKLTTFLTHTIKAKQFWCRGTAFDFPMIEAAISAYNTTCATSYRTPWQYYQCHDLRTVWNIAFPYDRPDSADHTALADCYAQIEQLAKANDRIIEICLENLTDRQLLDAARKRNSPELIHGTPLAQMHSIIPVTDVTETDFGNMPARNIGKKAALRSVSEWAEAHLKSEEKAPEFEDLYLAASSDKERLALIQLAQKHYNAKRDYKKANDCRAKANELRTQILINESYINTHELAHEA